MRFNDAQSHDEVDFDLRSPEQPTAAVEVIAHTDSQYDETGVITRVGLPRPSTRRVNPEWSPWRRPEPLSCPNCHALNSRQMAEISRVAPVDYYRCEECGNVWATEKGRTTVVSRLTTAPRKNQPFRAFESAHSCSSDRVQLPIDDERMRLLEQGLEVRDRLVLLARSTDRLALRRLGKMIRAHRAELRDYKLRLGRAS